MAAQTISPRELDMLTKANKNLELIDVRTPIEFREVHALQARNIPLDQLDPVKLWESRPDKSEPLYVVCKSGGRGGKACEKFREAGFTNVFNLEGGTQAWMAEGLPVVRGRKTVSLERQVRIAAGSLVLLGTILGWFVHPAFYGLAAFVGAGLTFSGITDTCGMGLALARMPWNRVTDANPGCDVVPKGTSV